MREVASDYLELRERSKEELIAMCLDELTPGCRPRVYRKRWLIEVLLRRRHGDEAVAGWHRAVAIASKVGTTTRADTFGSSRDQDRDGSE